jgi:hypothetical protein
MKINVLTTNNNPNSFSFNFPVRINKGGLSERGIGVDFFYGLNKKIYDCDIIFIDSKFFKYWWRDREDAIYGFLSDARKGTGAVLWFDTSDSTGTPNFKALPYVDGYYKSQILRDVNLYLNQYYRERIFFDFYHKNFGITDAEETGCEALPETSHLNKIFVSWNQALNDHGIFGNNYSLKGSIKSRLGRYFPFMLGYSPGFEPADKPRDIDIAARFGLSHGRDIVKFHRGLLARNLKEFNVDTAAVDHKRYYRELQNAKISISPFGLGEITYKDFETMLCGALLVKPDMGHMETWPDLYREGETYVSYKWDYSDFREKIEGLLSDRNKIRDLANSAQESYRYYISRDGRDEFCSRVEEIVKRYI